MADALANQTGSKSEDDQKLCILSLDGGGLRGLSSLHVLQALMWKVNGLRKAQGLEPVKPCHIFDLIGGTSTGGLIAIMLGRLEMGVEECIEAYKTLSEQVFGKEKFRYVASFKSTSRRGSKSQKLAKVVEDLVRDCTNGGDPVKELFNEFDGDGQSDRCKVYIRASSQTNSGIARLRSYSAPREPLADEATITQAAQATSAAPNYFEPVVIGGKLYTDGGFGVNNPSCHVWEEASNVWAPDDGKLDDKLHCFVSIGAEKLEIKPSLTKAWSTESRSAMAAAEQAAKSADQFHQDHHELFLQNRAFRFEVDLILEDVDLANYAKRVDICMSTGDLKQFIPQAQQLLSCAERLSTKQARQITIPETEWGEEIRVYLAIRRRNSTDTMSVMSIPAPPYSLEDELIRKGRNLPSP